MTLNENEMERKVWSSQSRAAAFLVFTGLMSMPGACPHGHDWRHWKWESDELGGLGVNMHCFHRGADFWDEDEEGIQKKKRGRVCNHKVHWRGPRVRPGEEPPAELFPVRWPATARAPWIRCRW